MYDYGDEDLEDENGEVVPDPNAKGWVAEVTFVCTDPVANGHIKTKSTRRTLGGSNSASSTSNEAAEEARPRRAQEGARRQQGMASSLDGPPSVAP